MELDYVNISDLSDSDVVAHMRKINYEQFKRLVRMHLSFELDLNTDEFDLPCHEIVYEDKGKLKKWNRLSKKHKPAAGSTGGSSTSTASADTSPTDHGMQQQMYAGFMFHLEELKEFLLLEKNLNQEGIFRKTGSVSRQNELRLKIQNDKPLDLEDGGYSAHDCATVFKGYLADLPEPLLTDAHYPAHLQIAPLCMSASTAAKCSNPERLKRHEHLLNSVQLLLLLLPDDNRQLLQHIIEILHTVIGYERTNKMSPENLATLFAPHLICPRKLPPEALHYLAKKMSSIVAYMIVRGDEIFEVPPKLSTDIRAYCVERKRKKTMSPERTLDESISDTSTVNTVYTFVDRERTAAAHTTNTTDTELAQLYAHIQSLPESSKKRRLIKQFNKQNGQGTPLQLVVMNRLKNSEASRSAKSISDSIKKHIFHKGLMSRTPKRPTTAMPVGVETPNFSNTKNPKLRVLFQSPAPSTPLTSANNTHHYHHHHQHQQQQHAAHTTTTPHHHTPYSHLKTHPLQKSSTTPLYASSLVRGSLQHKFTAATTDSQQSGDSVDLGRVDDIVASSSSSCNSSTSSGDGFHNATKKSQSAPVSRQVSSDLANLSVASVASAELGAASYDAAQNCCGVTPLKLLTDAAKQLITGGGSGGGVLVGGGHEKKSVAWDEEQLLNDDSDEEEGEEERADDCYNSNPCTPLKQAKQHNAEKPPSSELKSRYKSEPNLSRIMKDRGGVERASKNDERRATPTPTTPNSKQGKSLTRKLIKGVSMGNLKFPTFTTPDGRRRLTQRRGSDGPQCAKNNAATCSKSSSSSAHVSRHIAEPLDDLDDETFEDDPQDQLDSSDDEETEACDEQVQAACDEDDDVEEDDEDDDESTLSDEAADEDTDVDDIEPRHSRLPDAASGGSSSCSSELTAAGACVSGTSSGHSSLRLQYQQQQSSLYRNLDLITSTPSLLLGRRSMSPITKSTQRMPKAMQESIMTPRSRKPVMVLTTNTLNSTDQNQTLYQNDLSSFREQDEEEDPLMTSPQQQHQQQTCPIEPIIHNENATSLGGYADILRRQHLLQANQSFVASDGDSNSHEAKHEANAAEAPTMTTTSELTNNFKEYLLRRSVLTASPEDSSFASQPDDFDSSSAQEIDEIAATETQLSRSLLYCLDGNQPDALEEPAAEASTTTTTTPERSRELVIAKPELKSKNGGGGVGDVAAAASPVLASNNHRNYRLATNPFVIMNNARKRAASSELEKSPDKTKSTPPPLGGAVVTAAGSPSTTGHQRRRSQEASSRPQADNKENCEVPQGGYVLSRKLLITEYPGETSF